MLDLLVSARLVTADDASVGLAHEALTRAWPRLRTWLEEDAEGQRLLRHLAAAAGTWDTMGRPDSELYRGARLQSALEWQRNTRPDLREVESAFLTAAEALADAERAEVDQRARAQARQNRRLRVAVVSVAALVVVATASGVVADASNATTPALASAAYASSATLSTLLLAALEPTGPGRTVGGRSAPPCGAATESALLGTFTSARRGPHPAHRHPDLAPRATRRRRVHAARNARSRRPVARPIPSTPTTASTPGSPHYRTSPDTPRWHWQATAAMPPSLGMPATTRLTSSRYGRLNTGTCRFGPTAVWLPVGDLAINADGSIRLSLATTAESNSWTATMERCEPMHQRSRQSGESGPPSAQVAFRGRQPIVIRLFIRSLAHPRRQPRYPDRSHRRHRLERIRVRRLHGQAAARSSPPASPVRSATTLPRAQRCGQKPWIFGMQRR